MENIWRFFDAKELDFEEIERITSAQFRELTDTEKEAMYAITDPLVEDPYFFDDNYFANMSFEELNEKHNRDGLLDVTERVHFMLQSMQDWGILLQEDLFM